MQNTAQVSFPTRGVLGLQEERLSGLLHCCWAKAFAFVQIWGKLTWTSFEGQENKQIILQQVVRSQLTSPVQCSACKRREEASHSNTGWVMGMFLSFAKILQCVFCSVDQVSNARSCQFTFLAGDRQKQRMKRACAFLFRTQFRFLLKSTETLRANPSLNLFLYLLSWPSHGPFTPWTFCRKWAIGKGGRNNVFLDKPLPLTEEPWVMLTKVSFPACRGVFEPFSVPLRLCESLHCCWTNDLRLRMPGRGFKHET